MEITKININTNEWKIFTLIVIIAIIFFIFNLFKLNNEEDDLVITGKCFFYSILLFFVLPFILYIIHHTIPTNEYTIYYNKNQSTQTMTTQKIVDIIMDKSVYDESNGQTSTISITLPKENNDNYDAVYHHIEEIEKNTSNQKIKQEEQKQREQHNELKQKYLNQTHKVNVKNN
jgi:hypothetical protein